MKKILFFSFSVCLIVFGFNLTSCHGSGKNHTETNNDTLVDSIAVEEVEIIPQPGDSTYHFESGADILAYLDTCSDSSKYSGGILHTIAREVPDYADKLIAALSKYSKFIVVDKASMNVILYDRYGHVIKSYGCACAKNYGTKHRKADSRTPEGFFSLEGRYDSTDWLFTDDDGYTSPKKGQFGPRFLRLKIPTTSQIGIHGTASPWSIGHRVSHGCIRILNENILELYDLVEIGMPVIVLPGKRDRQVNRSEGYDIPYFPTDLKYAMTDAEKALPVKSKKEIEEEKKREEMSSGIPDDSISSPEAKETVEFVREEVTDSI